MNLEIIKGAITSPLTQECIKRMEEIRSDKPCDKVLFVVPEQFSYSAQKLITGHFGGTGLNNLEVMTMTQLTDRYLNRVRKNYLTDSGKAVLVQKAINEINKEDNLYGGCLDKPGFASTMSELITELNKCLITPSMLSECAQKTENAVLKRKLTSVADIYSRYKDLYSDRFYDADEDLTELANVILNENIFSDTHIFIDGFSNFFPKHYRVIDSMSKTAKSLIITLPADEDKEISQIPSDTLNRLNRLFMSNSLFPVISNVNKDEDYFDSKELKFYYNNYSCFNNRSFVPYTEKTNDIKLFYAKDPYSEVENVAKNIRYLVDEKGYRYRDISVCIGNSEEYIGIIQAVFNLYNIKYFTDVKLSIVDHPVILTIMSLFDIIKENWSYDSVFRYLKTGYIYKKEDAVSAFLEDDIDFLDYYVLKYGIKGKKKWLEDKWELNSSSISDALSEHKNDIEEENVIRVDEIRNKLVTPIKNFIEKTSGRNTVKNIATALFEFMEEIHLYEGLEMEIKSLSERDMINEAQQLSQVWNLLIDVLDQIITALGDIKCSREDFKNYIFSALSVNEIAIIPPALDGVSISSANAIRSSQVNAIFVIGAIKGVIPMEKSDAGMFSDNERKDIDELLEKEQREIGGGTEAYLMSEEYKLFRVLFSTKKLLTISYPLNDFNGEAQIPSQIFADIKKMFKNVTVNGDISDVKSEIDNYFTVNSAFDYLLMNRNNKNDKLVKKIYEWFLKNDKEKLDIIKNSDLYKVERAKIKSKNAELLYSDMLDYSASRLKVYADCPFQYFIKYGLRAKPEEVWQIQKFDLGTIMHYIVCKYCEIIENDADSILELRKRWSELTDEESDKIIDDIMQSLSKRILASVGKEEDKINYLLLRIKNIIKKSVEIVRISLTKGEYTAVEYEKNFSVKIENDDRKVGIRGTIDRIDISLYDEENAGIRIIDYKSGKKDFSVVSVCNMQDVQLILYATAATELFKMGNIKYQNPSAKAKITGIMYNKLKDSFIDANDLDKSNINNKKLKDMQLSGAIILEESEENFDISDAVKMDKGIEEFGESSFMNFSLKNDGTPKQSSDVLSRNSFDKLTSYVKKKIIDTDIEIMNGNIEILPYVDGNNSACDYCEMSEICLFDKSKDNVRRLCKNKEEAWDIIDKELQK